MYGVLGIKNRIVLILSVTEGTGVIIKSLTDDVWGSEDELISTFGDEHTFGHQFVFKLINMTLSSERLNTEKQMNIHIIFTYRYLILLY